MESRAHKYLETEETKMSNRRWNTQNIPAKMKVSRVKRSSGSPKRGEDYEISREIHNTAPKKAGFKKEEKKPYPGLRVKRSSGTPKAGENIKKKYKGFSKLPESVQRKINKKLAAKV